MAHVKPSLLSLSTYFSMVNCSYLFTLSPLTWTVLVEWKGRKRWKILDNAAPKGTAEVSPYVHLKEAISTDPQIVTQKKKKKISHFQKSEHQQPILNATLSWSIWLVIDDKK